MDMFAISRFECRYICIAFYAKHFMIKQLLHFCIDLWKIHFQDEIKMEMSKMASILIAYLNICFRLFYFPYMRFKFFMCNFFQLYYIFCKKNNFPTTTYTVQCSYILGPLMQLIIFFWWSKAYFPCRYFLLLYSAIQFFFPYDLTSI